ncbi:MAG: AmmeMemoRadiSam system protein B [Deltaproteobacteria bacterium]|nr:AmmeMemoRadiSam system protein B [Deltaproteobacteria bacterium]
MVRRFFMILTGVSFIFLCVWHADDAYPGDMEEGPVRQAIFAKRGWYPNSKAQLSRMIGRFLTAARTAPLQGDLEALIVPHAGYVYSGQVAAYAYKHLVNAGFERVIMIGPSHRARFRGVSVNLQKGYQTPLGTAAADLNFARKIIRSDPLIRWVPEAHAREHSLEIQVPFIQTVLPKARIVPILMWEKNMDVCSKLAKILFREINNTASTLLLASTDLSHFHEGKRARALDMEFIKYVRSLDPEGLDRALSSGRCEACGWGPAVTTLLTARKLGANRSVILNYANSGDVTGDYRQVVGYLSAALMRDN